ncbi:hypothetical protein BC832DRAFT_557843 [Gaertneriomyces semiglobifer]|nr:hypothetical protein BC832DRAFT_557843 [Gaertneriomyces semiglobifer]
MFGPQLPPHLQKRYETASSDDENEDSSSIGPQLPPDVEARSGSPSERIGPQIPPQHTRRLAGLTEDETNGIGPQLPPGTRDDTEETIGPQLPPHLAKRRAEATADEDDDSDTFGPALPPHLKKRARVDRDSEPAARSEGAPRSRQFGPAAPPPSAIANSSGGYNAGSDSEDEFGPRPPPSGVLEVSPEEELQERLAEIERRAAGISKAEEGETKLERGEWMLVPPQSRPELGPSMKNRSFARSTIEKNIDQSAWTESPEQKLERLRKEADPRKRTAPKDERRPLTEEERLTQEFVRKHNETHRGKSMMDTHTMETLQSGRVDEDDPSKRKFDWQKDIAGGRRIDTKTRREMVDKAKDLGGRFGYGSKTFL